MIKIDQEPKTEESYFDAVWDREFATRPWRYDTTRHLALTRKLEPGMSLVDLAAGVCGTAQFVAEVLKRKDVRLVALDRSQRAKEMVAVQCPQIEYHIGVLPNSPFADAEFDYVVATQIIEHQVEPEKLVAEMDRICKPGGWVVTAVHDKDNPAAIQHGPWPGQQWWMNGKDLLEMGNPYGKCELEAVGHYDILWCKKT